MKKVVIEKPGSYEQLKIKEFPNPKPRKGEVLIETRACGVNFADCCVRMGVYSAAKEFVGWPITPGFEVSGVITGLGEGVTHFSKGQKVIAITFFGGYATHLVVPESQVYPLPEILNFEQGASIPAVFITAYYGLFELAHPRKSNLLLVHSAAGGVGSSLIQLGKLSGCQTIGVVGATHKIEFLQRLEAHHIIDKSKHDLWKEAEIIAPKGFDVIFDANGAETLSHSYKHLKAGGKLVVYGFHTRFSKGRGSPNWLKMIGHYLKTPRFNPLNMTNDNHSVMAFNLSFLFGKEVINESLSKILLWFQEGKLITPPIKTYPLEQVINAHRDLESGNTIGKLILVPQ